MIRRTCVVVLFLLLAALSCHEPVTLPPVKGPPLKIPEGKERSLVTRQARGLQIVYVSPKGQLGAAHLQVTISFSKPMVSLEKVEGRARQSPLEITPRVSGTQRWLGSRTLVFQPEKPLAGSTVYTLRVPRGVKSVDGSVLEKEELWSFTTPLLAVANVVPYRGSRWEKPDTTVQLFFNQPVKPAALERHASFTVQPKGGAVTTLTAQVAQGKNPQHLVLRPATQLPLDAEVTLRVAAALRGEEGPKPMGVLYTSSFRTYGPFRMTGLGCTEKCDPERSVEVNFSNPVPVNDARGAIRVNGKAIPVGSSPWPSSSVWVDQKLKARTKYAVTLVGQLKDRFGQALEGKPKATFATGDYSPYVHLPIESGVLEASAPRNLPIFFRNAAEAKLRTKRMDPADVAKYLGSPEQWSSEKSILEGWDGVQTQQLKVAARPNTRLVQRVNLNTLLGGKTRGVLALELESKLKDTERSRYRRSNREDDVELKRALIRITDLAVTAKYSPHTSLVWVTSLASGKPVAGAAVTIFRERDSTPLWSGKTDAAGLAVAPGASKLGTKSEPRKFVFFAEKDGDLSFVDSTTQAGIRAWDFGLDETWDDESEGVLSLIFTDRGIYRPGDAVQIKGIMRRSGARGLVTPQGTGVDVVVSDARGEKIATGKRTFSEFGSYALEVKLPAAAPLGSYSVTAKADGGGAMHGSFRVEEYRPAEFKVAAQTERKEYVRGDSLAWSTTADYLFGSPMRRSEFRWYLYRNASGFAPPQHEGFVFADEVWWWGEDNERSQSGFVAQGQGRLDDRGRAAGTVPLKPPKMVGPQSYELEVSVTDVSRQSIASRTAALLHPGEFYIGGKPKETFLQAGKSLETEVVAAAPDGKRLSGVAIAGTLYLRTWTSVRKEGMGGAQYFVTRPMETAAGSCQVKSAAKPARCDIKVEKAGYYVLRLRAQDKRGNPLLTSFGVYVSGPDYVPWKRDNESKVELVTDRKSYKVGQVARILVKSPFSGAHGLFTVERNGIYTRQHIKLDRTAHWLEVPITEDLVPTAYVSVLLVRGRAAPPKLKATKAKKKQQQGGEEGEREERGDEDPGKPSFKVGYAKLVISQANRALKVAVKPARAEYRPGEEVVVDLAVQDAAGKGTSAELTVIVADEGVLSLIGYRTPDPMAIFYAERGLSVRTADNRIQLISQRIFGEKGGNAGGGGGGEGGSGEGVRRNFVSTPYFNPAVIADGSGKAQVRFKLPDNLTTFRVMAVAVSRAAEFGHAQGLVKVNKPLLLLPTLPRLVRVGDHIEAGVVVHNRSKSTGEVRVEATVRGLQLEGPAWKTVQVREGGSSEARFSFTAVTPGEATLRFRAQLGDQVDILELKRPVKLPLVIESVASFGSTETGAAEGVVPSSGVRSDVGGLEVAMSSSALVGLKAGMEYLLEYPYECLEQTTSRLVPLVLLDDLRQAFQLGATGDARGLVTKLTSKIEQLQRWDGGFSYWASGYQSYPWVSAYATWALHRAKQGGHKVSARVLDQGKRYLKNQLSQLTRPPPRAIGLGQVDAAALVKLRRDEQAYFVYVLTELGEKTAAYVSTLYEKRADLAVFSKALLLSAMTRLKSDAQMIATLTQELVNQVHQTGKTARVEENLGDGYAPFFHSDTRSSAIVLEALLRAKPEHPLVEKLVAGLLEARKEGRWNNTQETVYALLGMHTYFKVREKQVPSFIAKVFLGETKLMEQEFQGRSLTVFQKQLPMKELQAAGAGTLGFVKEGAGRLYYSARLRYGRTQLPKEPWDEGFYVQRTYERVSEEVGSLEALRGKDPEEPSAEHKDKDKAGGLIAVKAGDLVRVTLRIVAPQQMHFVAVDDPLPAGLEAMNFRLMTATQSYAREASFAGFRPRTSRHSYSSSWYTPFYHQEIRDDRIQLFADTVPPGVHTYIYLARATTIGKFVAAPTHVEQMYSPEVFGRSGSATFEVREK